ncbi:MAG: 3-isopropylmalate dehydratase small subunit 2 [Planctomycetaceae bacterium]
MQITSVTGSAVPLLLDDIDTDRIIPARFLRCVTFDGLGEHVFADDREQTDNHPFDNPQFGNGCILIAGRNFGCGSSREHAPQALMRWGIKAVVAESYAEIFFGNCTSLGIPAVTADRKFLQQMNDAALADSAQEFHLDLAARTLSFADSETPVAIPDGAHEALTTGQWDFLSQLLAAGERIDQAAAKLPYVSGFESGV